MRVHLRFLLTALMLQASHSISAGDDAKGWFEGDCGGTTFHITKFGGAPSGQELILRLSSGSPLPTPLFEGAGWLDVQGKRCIGSDKCEAGTQAKIWLNQTKGTKRISGKYTVNFSGQHLEGQFRVKYRQKKPPAMCE
jgi:hypothetical protein